MVMVKGKWKPLQSEHLLQAIEVCVQATTDRLKDPLLINSVMYAEEQRNQAVGGSYIPWNPLDLGRGFSGMCLLYGELDRQSPEAGWDVIGHQFLMEIQAGLETHGVSSPALWSGLAGVVMGARALSRQGTRYTNFITGLNEFFLQGFSSYLDMLTQQLERGVRMSDYDVMQGLSGIGRYLLCFAEEPTMADALTGVLQYMVKLCEERSVGDLHVPGWYLPPAPLAGSFNLGMSHGITGVLALMALSMRHGVEVSGQREAMQKIGDWLLRWKLEDEHGLYWAHEVTLEEYATGNREPAVGRAAWCYGTPGVARALWLAGEALGQDVWQEQALEAMRAVFRRPASEWGLESATFCHGLAGLLQITQRFYVESGDEELGAQRERLVEEMLRQQQADATFGFHEIEQGQAHNYPGLLDGAAGVLLSLLSVRATEAPEWDAVFMVS